MNHGALLILTGILCIATAVQLAYAWWFRFRPGYLHTTASGAPPSVSVVICARNEAANLGRFLPAVLEQDYPADRFEVIVVNDGSTDETTSLLRHFSEKYPQLHTLQLPPDTAKDLPGKKYALAKGIAAARFDRLLLTDADCRPASPGWLHNMTASDKDITLGYGAYEQTKGLLNAFIRWETVHTCMQYAGYAAAGRPYMGVGRNLSYHKHLLQALEGDTAFAATYRNTPSGDDDLLIGRIAGKDNTAICLKPEAHTISVAPQSWSAWRAQKTRHVSTGKYYPAMTRNLLGAYALSHTLYWLTAITALVCLLTAKVPPGLQWLIIAAISIRIALYWPLAAQWYKHLGEKKLAFFYPFGDMGWALYNVFLSPYILWKNKQAWK